MQVPGAGEVVGEPLRQVQAEEASGFRVVVGRRPAQQRLHQEQGGDDEEVPGRGPLGRGQRHLAWRQETQPALFRPVPAQQVGVAAEEAHDQADAAQQRHDRQRTPDDGFLGQLVADQRFGRPVVRVGVRLAGAAGRGGPGRPGDEGGDLADLLRVGDGARPHARAAALAVEDFIFVVPAQRLEGLDLPVGPGECVGGGVEAVGLEFFLDPRLRLGRVAVGLRHLLGLAVEVVGGEVGAEIGAVAVDRAVLHQAVGQERLLALQHVLAREQRLAGLLGNHLRRDGGVVLVDAQRQVAQDREAEHEGEDHPLEPQRGDHHRPTLSVRHCSASRACYLGKL